MKCRHHQAAALVADAASAVVNAKAVKGYGYDRPVRNLHHHHSGIIIGPSLFHLFAK